MIINKQEPRQNPNKIYYALLDGVVDFGVVKVLQVDQPVLGGPWRAYLDVNGATTEFVQPQGLSQRGDRGNYGCMLDFMYELSHEIRGY